MCNSVTHSKGIPCFDGRLANVSRWRITIKKLAARQVRNITSRARGVAWNSAKVTQTRCQRQRIFKYDPALPKRAKNGIHGRRKNRPPPFELFETRWKLYDKRLKAIAILRGKGYHIFKKKFRKVLLLLYRVHLRML